MNDRQDQRQEPAAGGRDDRGAYRTLAVSPPGAGEGIARVALDRPGQANAVDFVMWRELRAAFEALDRLDATRVIVLSGRGRHFCAGIDLSCLAGLQAGQGARGEGRRQEALLALIQELQGVTGAIARCRRPVLAAVHGACLGAGLDIAAACDMRYACEGATFSVREVDLAIVADLGSLQRLPALVGEGLARELAYTGRELGAAEAAGIGLVNRVFADRQALEAGVDDIARQISAKSPLTVRGIKAVMDHGREHGAAAGLAYVAARNASLLLSTDLEEAVAAALAKRAPRYED